MDIATWSRTGRRVVVVVVVVVKAWSARGWQQQAAGVVMLEDDGRVRDTLESGRVGEKISTLQKASDGWADGLIYLVQMSPQAASQLGGWVAVLLLRRPVDRLPECSPSARWATRAVVAGP